MFLSLFKKNYGSKNKPYYLPKFSQYLKFITYESKKPKVLSGVS